MYQLFAQEEYKNKKKLNSSKGKKPSQSSTSNGATATEEAKSVETKGHTVKCPKCNTNLKVKDEGVAYKCPNCNALLRTHTKEKLTKDTTGTTVPKNGR